MHRNIAILLANINESTELIYILIRTIIIYLYAIFLLRFASTRFRLQTPFDYVLIFILSAVLVRTLYGGTSLMATMLSSLLLIIMHEIFARLSFKYKFFGRVVKGIPKTLIENNQINWKIMRNNNITEDDLMEICRKDLKTENLKKIKKAKLERSGDITLIAQDDKE